MAKWITSDELVKLTVSDKVGRVTLSRPEKRNALSRQVLAELQEALLEADDLVDVAVIVLEGAGRDFCAGYDIGFAQDPKNQSPDPRYRTRQGNFDDDTWTMERHLQKMQIITELHKPVIAKVQGHALAGGAELALLCDMVIAAEDAKIGHPGTRAQGSPPNNMWFYHVGPQWAKRLLLSGDSVSGADAARIGLVMDAVPADQLDDEVMQLATRLAMIDPEILASNKRIVNLAMELSGAKTLQRLSAEMDARAHLSQGPGRKKFKADVQALGVRQAIKAREAQFGDGMVHIRSKR